MPLLYISWFLLVLFLLNEVIVVVRSPSTDRDQIKLPPYTAISLLLLFAPFFFALDLPVWLAWVAIALQVAGLLLEVTSELQLMRAHSFAISSGAATEIQKRGAYQWLENPIYIGIFLQLIGWAIWMPAVLICVALLFLVVRGMVSNERQFLATQHQATHRGIDSFLWG